MMKKKQDSFKKMVYNTTCEQVECNLEMVMQKGYIKLNIEFALT